MAIAEIRNDRGNKPRRGRQHTDGVMPYLLILPGLVFYTLFVLVPIVQTVRLSFFRWDGLLPEVWVGVGNYVRLLSNTRVWESFGVSAVFVFFSCILPVGVALVLVGAIARSRIRGLSFLRFVFFLPYTVALAVVAIAWRWLYASDGTVNLVIGTVLGPDWVRPFLGDFALALPAVGIVSFWATFGFVVVMLLSGSQHIPREQFEAARVDGAGPVREFFAVTLPGVRHELSVSLVMTFIMAMRMFDLPLVMTQGGPGYATTTPSVLMYRDVFINGQIGQGATVAVLITIVTLAGVAIINRALKQKD